MKKRFISLLLCLLLCLSLAPVGALAEEDCTHEVGGESKWEDAR